MHNNFVYLVLFMPVILGLGIITSWEDLISSTIRNKWVLTVLIYSICIYFSVWIFKSANINQLFSYKIGNAVTCLSWNIDKWCINLLIGSLAAYFFWHYKVWGAGDAKLFICYCALIPMGQYSKVYFNYYFASFFLLLAVFIPATVFLLVRALFYHIRRFKLVLLQDRIRELLSSKRPFSHILGALKAVFGFFVLFLLFNITAFVLQSALGRAIIDQNLFMILLLPLFGLLSKFFQKNTRFMIVFAAVLILCILLGPEGLRYRFASQALSSFFRSILVMVIFLFCRKVTDLYIERNEPGRYTPFAHWMFLGVIITWFF
ncbi:MAG: hypothetical protein NTY47_07900 [Candidatus Omnitrophica bacterium]|nr:hypothetical protein [Candidatus Omnitrophota bacterium]